jgi:hypothetical protein
MPGLWKCRAVLTQGHSKSSVAVSPVFVKLGNRKKYGEVLLLRLLKIDIFNSRIFQCILAFDAENSRILYLHISVIHA